MRQKLPNLICPGAQKSGTTTLYSILNQHPDIYMSIKEAHYFDMYYDRGFDYYESLFEGAQDEKYISDMTPVYMMLDDVPGLICNDLGPDVKFVFILRNPVDRIYSAYDMKRAHLIEESNSLEDALVMEDERISIDRRSLISHSYLIRGYYAKQIKNFIKYFSVKNMHFIIFEDFIKDMEGESRKLFEFLELDVPDEIDFNQWSNVTIGYKNPGLVKKLTRIKQFLEKFSSGKLIRNLARDKRHLFYKFLGKSKKIEEKTKKNPETCRMLIKKYIEDIRELEDIIGKDLSFWIEKYL